MGITDKIFDWMKRDSEETSLFQDSPKPSNEDNIINMVTAVAIQFILLSRAAGAALYY